MSPADGPEQRFLDAREADELEAAELERREDEADTDTGEPPEWLKREIDASLSHALAFGKALDSIFKAFER